jgi:hypothetical protein
MTTLLIHNEYLNTKTQLIPPYSRLYFNNEKWHIVLELINAKKGDWCLYVKPANRYKIPPPPPTQYVIPPNMIMYCTLRGVYIIVFFNVHLLLDFSLPIPPVKGHSHKTRRLFHFYSTVFLQLFSLANIEYKHKRPLL